MPNGSIFRLRRRILAQAFNKDKWQSGGSHYIEPEDIGTTRESDWNNELIEIKNILNQYGITILTE